MDLDAEIMPIMPVYLRYAKQYSTLLPFFVRLSFFLFSTILMLGFFHHLTKLPMPIWEQWTIAGLMGLAALIFLLSTLIQIVFSKIQNPERAMRERLASDRAFLDELRSHSHKARLHFLEYLRHEWEVQETAGKVWAATTAAFGGLMSAASGWMVDSKKSFAFFLIISVVCYIGLISHQRVLVQWRRFGYLLGVDSNEK